MESGPHKPERDVFTAADPLMEWTDRAIHVVIGALFLIAAIVLIAYSVRSFFDDLTNPNFLEHLTRLINDLLLALIILEVLSTVRSYLLEGRTSLKPFLVIGIISATRRILAVGASAALGQVASEAEFRNLMIDLGVNALVVLGLALSFYLFSRAEASVESTEGPPAAQ